jgi:G3E family GTPase
MSDAVPVTLLTGFLGAGKTTLLNRLLRNPAGRRIGVLVNDFGDVGIDGLLVESVDRDTITFAGGCLCCQVRDNVPQAVSRLLARPDRPEHLVVEASGVANPFDVAAPFTALAPTISLDGVVGVVDAERLTAIARPDGSVDWTDLVIDHVMASDIVVLNKVDLVDDTGRERARELIADAVSRARVLECVEADVPTELLLGLGGTALGEQDERAHHDHAHDQFESWSFSTTEPLREDALRAAIRALSPDVIRGKGVLRLADKPGQMLFQLVGTRWTLTPGADWDREPRTDVVLIGPKGRIDHDALSAALRACVA